MKGTRRKRRIFSSSKLIKEDYTEDKKSIVNHYNNLGFRDARILGDSVWRDDKGQLMINIDILEGNQYYFRNIAWKGKYEPVPALNSVARTSFVPNEKSSILDILIQKQWISRRPLILIEEPSISSILRNVFNKKAWNPLPQGDGQRLSLRAQTSGAFFQSYNISFTEPWLGGKKPTSLTVSAFFNRLTNGGDPRSQFFERFNILGGSIGLGTRLKWPDDNFVLSGTINLQRLSLDNYTRGGFQLPDGTRLVDGSYNNFSLNVTLARSTINNPIYPVEGSRISLSFQPTIPYSLFNNKDYGSLEPEEKFRFLEYHKWRFNAEWYAPLVNDKLVLRIAAKVGIIGAYNDEIGLSPFEQFQLGGDGLSQQTGNFYNGVDLISLRGYEVRQLDANVGKFGEITAAPIFDKFTVELRYPLSLNPNATIFFLAFAEGGNSWESFRDFNPFRRLRR